MSKYYKEIKQIIRYGFVGIFSNSLVYTIFLSFLYMGIDPTISSGICYCIGLTLSFIINRNWTFASSSNALSDLRSFGFSYAVGFVFSMLFMFIVQNWIEPEFVQIANIFITALVIYACLKITGFGKKRTKYVS